MAPDFSLEERGKLVAELEKLGWDKAMERLREKDPEGGATLPRNSFAKLATAVHTVETSGKPQRFFGQPAERPPFDYRAVALYYQDREALMRLLDRRCHEIIAQGLIHETVELLKLGALQLPDSDSKDEKEEETATRIHGLSASIGYRQVLQLIQRCFRRFHSPRSAGSSPQQQMMALFHQFVAEYQAATRELSRQQNSFLRTSRGFCGIPVDAIATDPTRRASLALDIAKILSAPPEEYVALRDRSLPLSSACALSREDSGRLRRYQAIQVSYNWPAVHDLMSPIFCFAKSVLNRG